MTVNVSSQIAGDLVDDHIMCHFLAQDTLQRASGESAGDASHCAGVKFQMMYKCGTPSVSPRHLLEEHVTEQIEPVLVVRRQRDARF